MTTLSAESSGIEMRRAFLILLLLAALLLTGCSARFAITETGYTDTKTGRHYVALPAAYEASAGEEEVGTFEDEAHARVVRFRVISGADAARFLADEEGAVYCADEVLPDAAAWTLKQILVCEEDAISYAYARITDVVALAEIKALWFAGEESELPLEEIKTNRRLKLASDDCPGIYYCVNYYIYESGAAYFYDIIARRAVSVPAALAEKIPLN